MTVAIILVNSISFMVCAIDTSWFLNTIKIHFLPERYIIVYFKIISSQGYIQQPNVQTKQTEIHK